MAIRDDRKAPFPHHVRIESVLDKIQTVRGDIVDLDTHMDCSISEKSIRNKEFNIKYKVHHLQPHTPDMLLWFSKILY